MRSGNSGNSENAGSTGDRDETVTGGAVVVAGGHGNGSASEATLPTRPAAPTLPTQPADTVDGRTRHYGAFYGIDDIPPDDGRPLAVAWGNCQAESIRVLLDGAPSASVRSVRVPPAHELTPADLPWVRRLLGRVDLLLAQPVRDDYRGMPLGTAQVAALLPPGGRVVRWPVLRDAGLHPFQVLVRHVAAPEPPVVPYHDLRTVLEAATGRRPAGVVDPRAYRELAAVSVEELRRREQAHGTVVAHDLVADRSPGSFHTVNHPGNGVLIGVARRLQEAAGLPADATDPGRVLLRSVLAPQDPAVYAALGLSADPGRDAWLVAGERVEDEVVRRAQLEHYRRFPEVVDRALVRHAAALRTLGLGGGA